MSNTTDQFKFKVVEGVQKVIYNGVTRNVTLDGYIANDGWDDLEFMILILYNCLILKDFGSFKSGDIVDSIMVNHEKGEIDVIKSKKLSPEGDNVWSGKMSISIN